MINCNLYAYLLHEICCLKKLLNFIKPKQSKGNSPLADNQTINLINHTYISTANRRDALLRVGLLKP